MSIGRKNHQRFWIAGVACIVTAASWALPVPGSAQSNDLILARLRQKDGIELLESGVQSASTRGFYISFVMTTRAQPFDEAQGLQINYVDSEWTHDWCVMKMRSTFDRSPVFRKNGTKGYDTVEWDSGGNLILWRPEIKYMFFGTNKNDTLEISNMYKINPQDNSTVTNSSSRLIRFNVGDRNNIYVFDQLRAATGRGFGSQIISIIGGITVEPSGRHFFRARAVHPSGLKGIWEIRYDDQNDPLVRDAIFFANNQAEPTIQIENSGSINTSHLRIAETGTFSVGTYSASFQVLCLTTLDDTQAMSNALYKEVSEHIEESAHTVSEVTDLRGDTAKRSFTNDAASFMEKK